MAYVGGGYNARLIRQVRRAGYTTARSVVRGIHQDPAHRFTLRVVRVAARDDVLSVAAGIVDPLLPDVRGQDHRAGALAARGRITEPARSPEPAARVAVVAPRRR